LIAGVTVQDNSIGTLLRAALEETGAQRGSVILLRSGERRVAAQGSRRCKKIAIRICDEVVADSLLPGPALDYVERTREPVVINDEATRARFAVGVRQHKVASILCLPLLHPAQPVGLLILESDRASGVFTPARLRILKLVASLAASSLVNSRLYDHLQERETRIRRLVDANILGIFIVDIRGPILESNDAYLRMLGYERGDLNSGRLRWTELTPPEWHAADKMRVERVKRLGRVLPFEKEFLRKDGTRVPVLMGVARFKEPKTQAVVFAHDMSKQKQAAAMALESRSIEDMRVARKLHDALLQNFQAMMFRFQAVRNLITRRPDEAVRSLDAAINDGKQALVDSLNAIQAVSLDPNRQLPH
jgi:PAS domain S-box-containing protein